LIRAVLDSNVFVSAFISRRGSAPDLIVRAWHQGAFEVVMSPRLLAELSGVFTRPHLADAAGDGRGESYVARLRAGAILVDDPLNPPRVSPDPDDDYLFALARTAHADPIVSGDRHLTELTDPTPLVVTPRAFADRLQEETTETER
jgi:uncharacterized protein